MWKPEAAEPAQALNQAVEDLGDTASVILPALNAGKTIAAQLEAISAQTYELLREIIVADNGSSDGTRAIVHEFALRDIRIRLVDASGTRGPAYARNVGASHSHGKYLLFCDADDVADTSWVAGLIDGLRESASDAVGGLTETETLNPPRIRGWHPTPRPGELLRGVNGIRFIQSCNMLVTRLAFCELNGFEQALNWASEDVDFSWRLQQQGYTISVTQKGIMHYRHRRTLRELLKQYYRYGRGNPIFLDLRGLAPIPLHAYLKTTGWLAIRVAYLLTARRRGIWAREAARFAGQLMSEASLRFRSR